MPSAWILKRPTKGGRPRYCVVYRIGGRESVPRRAGTFERKDDANRRRAWVVGELAAMRVPDLSLLADAVKAPTVAEVAARWQASRVDVAENTQLQHRSAVRAMLPLIGDRRVDTLTPTDVAELV